MFTHDLDPNFFDFGFFAIRWYSLAYIFGILFGWWYGKKIIIKKSKTDKNRIELNIFDDFITYIIISIIVGGRLGYVFFYNLEYFIKYPLDIIKIWQGGMSFHGALIGIVLGAYLFSIKKKIHFLFLLDIIACVSPVGIFFGRVANFINGELVGKVTNVYWGVIFPNVDLMPRHPSQLYEAILEGLLLFFVMNKIMFNKNYITGRCAYSFLIIYGFLRMFVELFREPDEQIGYLFDIISMGSFLSIIMIIIGGIMILRRNEN